MINTYCYRNELGIQMNIKNSINLNLTILEYNVSFNYIRNPRFMPYLQKTFKLVSEVNDDSELLTDISNQLY